MQDSIEKVIANALTVNKDNLSKNIMPIINGIKEAIDKNKDNFIEANKIDYKNNNGFMINFNTIENIFANLEKETLVYGDVILSQKDDLKKIVYGKEIFDYGIVAVINDGNPYVMLEMIIRNIMAGNTTIFSNNGYMFGTNKLLFEIIQAVLENFNVSKYLIQLTYSSSQDDILSNYANIDLIVCIGNREMQNMVLSKSKNKTITSGYENFDIYMEDKNNIDFIKQLMNMGLNIQLFIKSDLDFDYKNAIMVNDIDEAIAQINYNGNKYSSAIFTDSKENASKFIREVKSKQITVNTSPTIERIIDIQQEDLVNIKTVIYPMSYNFDGNKIDIQL